VIKVEYRGRLDNARLRGRSREWRDVVGPSIELAPYFQTLNRGKKSITVNIKDHRGLELIHDLTRVSDVLIENLSRGALERANLGPGVLLEVNPKLVYVSMSAAGDEGPLRDIRAYAPITSSLAGLEALVGYPDGTMTGMMTFGLSDGNAGSHALLAVMAGLFRKNRTGLGLHLDVPQLDSLLAVMAEPVLERTIQKREPMPTGNRRHDMAPRGIYPTRQADRWIALAVQTDQSWTELVRLMGTPDWSTSPELATARGRYLAHDLLDNGISTWSRTRDRDELSASLRKRGINASPVLTLKEMREHPYFKARGLTSLVQSELVGDFEVFATPWTLSSTPPQVDRAAPQLGLHNDDVFMSLLGRSEKELDLLRADGVID